MARWHALEAIIRDHGWRSGAELGVFKGSTFCHLLRTFSDLELIGVDLWEQQPLKERHRARGGRGNLKHDLPACYDRLIQVCQLFGKRARLIRASTMAAAASVSDGSLDFVFIDACHLEESVRADIQAWRMKVRPGGALLGHDIDWPSVRAAVDDLCPGWEEHPHHIWLQRQ